MAEVHPTLTRLRTAVATGRIGLPWSVVIEHRATNIDLTTLAATVTHLTGLLPVDGVVWEGPEGHLSASITYERGLVSSLTALTCTGPEAPHHLVRAMGTEGVVLGDLANPSLVVTTAEGQHRQGFGAHPSMTASDLVSSDELAAITSVLARARTETSA